MGSASQRSENLLAVPFQSNGMSPLSGKSGEICEILERRFASGAYRFGELLSPTEIAEEFGVSQQPVRAALAQLRALGYVIVVPQVGCRVASPSSQDISDFFLVFSRMEGVVAALAARRHKNAEVARLDAVSAELVECVSRRHVNGMPENYAALVDEWHDAIRDMAHSDTMGWRMRSFWRMSDFLLWQAAPYLEPEKLAVANRQREAIRDSIIARDAETVEHLMAAHVRGKPARVGILTGSSAPDRTFQNIGEAQ